MENGRRIDDPLIWLFILKVVTISFLVSAQASDTECDSEKTMALPVLALSRF